MFSKKMDYTGKTTPEVVDKILEDAIRNRASDVHLDYGQKDFVIRMRVDGILSVVNIETVQPEQVVSRIKVLAQLDITEYNLPQDGRFEFKTAAQSYNVRVSTMPTIYGEAIALRILERDSALISLSDSGLEPKQIEMVKGIIGNPYGMVLVSGPTGSGKTTFLYSTLQTFDRTAKNIVTIEDPVESPLSGVRQVQIDEARNLTFSKAIRGILRQDPNIIMLGEIRDNDTAQLAFQAALTGMLVFSTFHTFDITGLVIRLIEMGVPRSVIAHALGGVISVRLVRKVCPTCAAPVEPLDAERKLFSEAELFGSSMRRGKGCDMCHGSGYLGRTGLFEVVPCDDEFKAAIIENESASALRAFVKRKTARTMADAARAKIMSGTTTTEEVINTIGSNF